MRRNSLGDGVRTYQRPIGTRTRRRAALVDVIADEVGIVKSCPDNLNDAVR